MTTMPERDDLHDLFAPLRTETTASAAELARVRAAAAAPAPRSRRRWVLSGSTVVVAAGVAAVLVLAIDRSHPGTFVGEAGARELLRAAADATRDEPAQDGWRWTTTVRVQRMALVARRCRTCPVERSLLETRSTHEQWNGPRGEAYATDRQDPPRAIENEPLLRAHHALDVSTRPREFGGTHVVPAAPGADDAGSLVGLSSPGGIADPSAVPDGPRALVRWVGDRLHAQDRAQRALAKDRGIVGFSTISWATRISYALVDVATSPQLSGAQQAAAFEALADRPAVTAVRAPAAFASPDRVAVRIAARTPAGREDLRMPFTADRVIVFDRGTHRVIAEEMQPTPGAPRARFSFGEGRHRGTMELAAGGGGETRYGDPVAVPGPGLDADGHRRMALTGLLELDRDGQGRVSGPRGTGDAAGRGRRGG
ncbi:hypothetical protein AB0L40_23490 [Patulibacter sp. NPDC049589]|uniref:hypothetical protein n=1 Tax=Patulibacter sp. NPDC049589 TaxID=3154731 RepID=UPI003422FFE0